MKAITHSKLVQYTIMLIAVSCLATGAAVLSVSPGTSVIILVIAGVALLNLGAAWFLTYRQRSRYAENLPFLPQAFLAGLAIILTGYMLFGKGFAYIHLPVGFPLYVGEAVLLLGLIALFLHFDSQKRCWNPVTVAYGLFAFLGAVRMLSDIRSYGIDAVRDSVVWYYGLFMILVLAFVMNKELIAKAFRLYTRFAPFMLVIAAVLLLVQATLGFWAPYVPGTKVPMVWLKGGDLAVHIGILIALFCFSRPGEVGAGLSSKTIALIAILLGFVACGFTGRGSLLSMVSAASVAFIISRRLRLFVLCGGAFLLILAFSLLDVNIETTRGRDISVNYLQAGVKSVFSEVEETKYARVYKGTKEWRLNWWREIINRTTSNPKTFWLGRGFGPNMADEMGFQTSANPERPLRSPHNVHLTILYRMGLPGAVLWIALNSAFVLLMLGGIRRARNRDRFTFSGLTVILCFWVAAHINGTFDVYLEGPMGGIWFWVVIGIGLSLLRIGVRRDLNTQPSTKEERND